MHHSTWQDAAKRMADAYTYDEWLNEIREEQDTKEAARNAELERWLKEWEEELRKLDSAKPVEDDEVEELDDYEKAGIAYEEEQFERYKRRAAGEPEPKPKKHHIDVAGVSFRGRANIWKRVNEAGEDDIRLVREPNNPYDDYAIAVVVGDEVAGYVPADKAEKLAGKMGAGARPKVTACKITIRPGEGRNHTDYVNVRLTYIIP